MSKTPQTGTAKPDDGIPASLRRDSSKPTTTSASPVDAQKAPSAVLRDLTKGGETAPAKPNRKERRAAAKAAKAQAKTPAHQPSTIASTATNPSKSIVPPGFKAKYAEHGGSNGDEVAHAVRAFIYTRNDDGREVLDMSRLEELAKVNGIDYTAYKSLNNGQKSMNVRNRLRGMLKAGKKVTVGKRTFADKDKALAVRPAPTAA